MHSETFEQTLRFWYKKSKQVLKHRPDKKKELVKRLELLEYAEQNPDFTINMVNICGLYEIVGGNPDLKKSYYTGTLKIDLISNQIEVSWLIEGEQEQTGYGFVFNNILVIHFSYTSDKQLYNGIVAYEFLTPEIVVGKWTEEIAVENAFEMGRKLTPKELGEPYPEDFFSAN
ncbi:hypothetical protein [Wenyingzhuangia sp. 2_MG-2023]|uniref:hypothetical protein n=1 Tax=Wenyingzhuangia sp. 2_MG-2023 TaxID=3062639 RepID=UPI0026E364ED|nr:hypothetical protein [Wenyingzhuangia sp. 2_MG-2023]MDO6737514.1 hypothetical protein [Wenyingzhuangia sp. 2_MG-2023]MDO6802817.1 hypothetical protein [Wenyingzhuangia sp. 1_MG-2023]